MIISSPTLKASAVILLAALISACNTNSSITHSYVDPVLKELGLDGVLVIAISKKQEARKDFEQAFADALNRRGVRAVAGHTLLSANKPSSEEVITAAKKANLDTIMVTRYLGKMTDEIYHPGTIYYGVTPAYGAGYHGGFGGYYGRAYEVAYEQPVWTTNVVHTLVSDLYVTATKDHMWQAVSDTIQASGDKKLRNDAINGLIGNLKDEGMLD
jgi:nucleotide-binding universal stress UspA family protein